MNLELGQGACQAILDAFSLAQHISTNPSITTALRAYGRDRKPRAWMTTLVARAVAATGRADGPFVRTARERAMTLLPKSLFLRLLRARPSRQ
jgi:2-polyprenyl-6-methoxyphenol hydroxylase-like FAD-dependent oxidoreductase